MNILQQFQNRTELRQYLESLFHIDITSLAEIVDFFENNQIPYTSFRRHDPKNFLTR